MTKDDQQKPRILIVLPTLGQRLELLKKTLNSIAEQTTVNYDIVMIFPLKNKETMALAKKYNALTLDDPGGLSAAVNAGIASAKPWHEYIGWIGDDDLIAPGSLQRGIKALDKHPEAVISYGYCDYIDDDGRKITTSKAGRFAPWIMTWGPNLLPCPGTIFRLSALHAAGPFDENLKYSMDLDMFLRLRKLGKFVNTKHVQASFRWHTTSMTVASRQKVLAETELVKRKYLPSALKPFAPLWERFVRTATVVAAKLLTSLAAKKPSN